MEFNDKTIEIAIAQFFGKGVTPCIEQPFDERADTYFRWLTFSELLLNVNQQHTYGAIGILDLGFK
jgi:hypothetical protein